MAADPSATQRAIRPASRMARLPGYSGSAAGSVTDGIGCPQWGQ